MSRLPKLTRSTTWSYVQEARPLNASIIGRKLGLAKAYRPIQRVWLEDDLWDWRASRPVGCWALGPFLRNPKRRHQPAAVRFGQAEGVAPAVLPLRCLAGWNRYLTRRKWELSDRFGSARYPGVRILLREAASCRCRQMSLRWIQARRREDM